MLYLQILDVPNKMTPTISIRQGLIDQTLAITRDYIAQPRMTYKVKLTLIVLGLNAP